MVAARVWVMMNWCGLKLRGGRKWQLKAKLVERLGAFSDPKAFMRLAIAEFGLPCRFDDVALQQAEGDVPSLAGREDLLDVPFVTIDGKDARDFDDAVWAEPHGEGWRILVAIADVSAYVRAGSALDAQARLRGNSVYLPEGVIPMLPENLSENLCSLKPDVERACLAVEVFIDSDGRKIRHRFRRGVMRSVARLTYEYVQQVMDGGDFSGEVEKLIGNLRGAFLALGAARDGALRLSLAEKQVVLDEAGGLKTIILRRQEDAHRLIEYFMVLANICTAEVLEEAGCVYRVHDRPDGEAMQALGEGLKNLGLKLKGGREILPENLNQILADVRGAEYEAMVHEMVLRCQARAVYAVENIGHYGLGLKHYAHFTSPIRRYADLMVHRALIECCGLGEGLGGEVFGPDREEWGEICVHLSATEQRAVQAERRVVDRWGAVFVRERWSVGDILEGMIVGMNRAGLFVALGGRVAEGFLGRASLPGDYYVLDKARMTLSGRRTGWRFRVGDRMECSLHDVCVVSGEIRLGWISGGKQIAVKDRQKKR